MSALAWARLLTGMVCGGLTLLGVALLPQASSAWVRTVPRAKIPGVLLSTLCWVWVGAELAFHPIDFLAFLTPGRAWGLAAICALLSPVLLENLLCARAIGGLMMLWPMPVILAVRDQVTDWRLVPVTLGYVSLTLGMLVVFYPWMLRVQCERLSEQPSLRRGTGVCFLVVAALMLVTLAMLGKEIGE